MISPIALNGAVHPNQNISQKKPENAWLNFTTDCSNLVPSNRRLTGSAKSIA